MPTAPLPVLPGVYYARIEATCDTKPITNIVAFKKAGLVVNDPADALNAAAVAIAVSSNWPAVPTALLDTNYTGVQVSVYPLGSVLVPAATHSLVAPGGRTGPERFVQVAGRIKHTVARRGRGSQHSTHLSPISTDDINAAGDQLISSWVSAANSAWNTFIADTLTGVNSASPGTWTYVQVSKFQNKVYTGASYPILSSAAQALIGSQRRRLGRG